MIPKGMIETIREWVNQRLGKEVFKTKKFEAPQRERLQKENSNPNMGTAQTAVCRDW